MAPRAAQADEAATNPLRTATGKESTMALRAAKADESGVGRCVMLDSAWAVEVGTALDQLKP